MTTTERFWPKVQKGPGCWTWTGCRLPNGYGRFRCKEAGDYAHRASWLITRGPIPAGLLVLHHCDNPSCVRPEHLFLGTGADNVHDAQRKGRRPTALHPPRTPRYRRLTPEEVRTIRERHVFGESINGIARSMRRSPSAIFYVVRGGSHSDVDAIV